MSNRSTSSASVFGVTGGIGSGKTVFARALGRLGARVIDADETAKRLVDSDPDIRNALKKTFGGGIFDGNGRVDRRKLAEQAFSDSAKLNALNGIVWPALISEIQKTIKDHQSMESSVPIVVDMAVLYEAGCESMFDSVVAVEAPLEERVRRISRSRAWSAEEIRRRMAAQMDVEEKSGRADWIVKNNGDLESLDLRAREVFDTFLHRANKRKGTAS